VSEIRRLGPGNAAAFREARLECLCLHPENFGTVWEVEKERPVADFAAMLDEHRFWGGFRGANLDGIVGFYVMPRAKERHRGVLYAMYVREAARGTGLGRRLLGDAIRHADRRAFPGIYLTTFAGLDAARHLYESAGFALAGESATDRWSGGVREQRFERLLPSAE